MAQSRPKRSILDDLVDEEPELHHYTTIDGLKGILQSNALWGTHFRLTNDSTEFILMHTLLIQKIVTLLSAFLEETYRVNLSFRNLAHATSGTFETFLNDHGKPRRKAERPFARGEPTFAGASSRDGLAPRGAIRPEQAADRLAPRNPISLTIEQHDCLSLGTLKS